MKYTLVLISMIVSLKTFAQEDSLLRSVFPYQENKVHYESIVTADSSEKLQLFEKAKIWSLKTFNSSKDAEQSEDKELGFITYKTYFDVPIGSIDPKYVHDPAKDIEYWFKVKIYLKDKKAKILIDDIMVCEKGQQEKSNLELADEAAKTQDAYLRKMLHAKRYDKLFTPEALQKEKESTAVHYRLADNSFKSFIESFRNAMVAKPENNF